MKLQFTKIMFQISNILEIYCSNSFLFTNFLFPTYKTKLHFGCFNNSSILLIPMFEYVAASLIVIFNFSQNGISKVFVFVTIISHLLFSFILSKIILGQRNPCPK